MLTSLDPIYLIYILITFVVSISLHEYAHAWMSDRLWDPTPKIQWRLTPDPRSHIDPLWLVLIFLIWFGRGRPVLVNPKYYKNPIRDELFVALAGPATNIILAIISILIIGIYGLIVWQESIVANPDLVVSFWKTFGMLNVTLAVFNMIPIPPLDGYRLISFFYPSAQVFLLRYQRYFWIALLALIFLPGIGQWFGNIIYSVTSFIYNILRLIFSGIFVR